MFPSLNRSIFSHVHHVFHFSHGFRTKTPQAGLSSLTFKNIYDLLQNESEINSRFKKHGYLVLSAPTTSPQLLFDVARLFGKIQRHVRSPEDGIVEIRSKFLKTQDKQISSNLHFVAHTDGHYLEGLARQENQIFRIAPPKIIVLQCVKPATDGGVNFIVDARAILLSIIKNHPHLLTTLFARNCMSICRENHLIMDLPIFKKLSSGNFSVRFSYDLDLHVPSWAKNDISFFNNHYILNPKFATFFSLAEGEMLVLDNHRYLHGRTEVKGERIFRRIWVQDESTSIQMYTLQNNDVPYYGSSLNPTQTSFHYQPYAAIDDLKEKYFKAIEAGIALTSKKKLEIEKYIQASTMSSF